MKRRAQDSPTTYRSETQSVTLDVDPRTAFEFVANPENLPQWAVRFAKAVRRDGNDWYVQTAQGEVRLLVAADARWGVIDFHIFPAPGVELVPHTRVTPNGSGAEYVFTQYQYPGLSDEDFREQVESLAEELSILGRVLVNAKAGVVGA